MNIIVTGATSFLGASVIKKLDRMGHSVFAIVRPNSKNIETMNGVSDRVHIIALQMEAFDDIASVIQVPCEIFFHFAWDGSGSEGRKNRTIQQKNIVDSMAALNGAKALGCKRFLFSGSQAEYGNVNGPMKENIACAPVSEYGKAKLEFYRRASAQCKEWKDRGEYTLTYIHTRIFSVYGPGDHPWTLISSCITAFLQGETVRLSNCSQTWNYIYIDDVTDAMMELAFCENTLSADGIYNIAAERSENRQLCKYVEEIHEICGRTGHPAFGVRPPNAEGETDRIPDISKIIQDVGWKPKMSFQDGIQRVIAAERATI